MKLHDSDIRKLKEKLPKRSYQSRIANMSGVSRNSVSKFFRGIDLSEEYFNKIYLCALSLRARSKRVKDRINSMRKKLIDQ